VERIRALVGNGRRWERLAKEYGRLATRLALAGGSKKLRLPRPRLLRLEEAIRELESSLGGDGAKGSEDFDAKLKTAALGDAAEYAGEVVTAVERHRAGKGVHSWREGDLFTCMGWTRAEYPYYRDPGSAEGAVVGVRGGAEDDPGGIFEYEALDENGHPVPIPGSSPAAASRPECTGAWKTPPASAPSSLTSAPPLPHEHGVQQNKIAPIAPWRDFVACFLGAFHDRKRGTALHQAGSAAGAADNKETR
jgi:hypothetical protein